MKFMCVPCNEPMSFENREGADDGSMSLVLACQKCNNKVSVTANPQETGLIKSMGLEDTCLGGAKEPSVCPAHACGCGSETKESSSSDEITWTEEAKARLEKVPEFVREMAKMGVIKYATDKGINEITPAVMDDAREEMGM